MNQEFKHTTLKKAITRLPIYEPPDQIWQGIENELTLQNKLKKLPNRQPPALLWRKIEANLVESVSIPIAIGANSGSTNTGSTSNIRWIKRLSIAAAVLLIFGGGWWELNPSNVTQLSYAQEKINPQLLIADWDEDMDALNQIEAICQTKNYICTAPEFLELEQELQELNEAKLDLKQAIDNFGKDMQLIVQLSEVELERTAILKKMMANIL